MGKADGDRRQPTREEVLEWMVRTGGGAAEAVDQHWPRVAPPERERLVARVRQWATRARRRTEAAAEPSPRTSRDTPPAPVRHQDPEQGDEGDRIVRPPRRDDLVAADRIAFLEWQLGENIRDLEAAREAGLLRLAPAMDARVSEVRAELDDARGEAGRSVRLDRSPVAVAAEMRARQAEIDQLLRAREEAAVHEARERSL